MEHTTVGMNVYYVNQSFIGTVHKSFEYCQVLHVAERVSKVACWNVHGFDNKLVRYSQQYRGCSTEEHSTLFPIQVIVLYLCLYREYIKYYCSPFGPMIKSTDTHIYLVPVVNESKTHIQQETQAT